MCNSNENGNVSCTSKNYWIRPNYPVDACLFKWNIYSFLYNVQPLFSSPSVDNLFEQIICPYFHVIECILFFPSLPPRKYCFLSVKTVP